MKKLMLVAIMVCGTLPLAGCFFGPYDDGHYDHRRDDGYYNDHRGYYDRVGAHGYYNGNRDTPDGYYR